MLNDINSSILLWLNSFLNNELISNIVYKLADIPIFFIPIFLIVSWIYYRSEAPYLPTASSPPREKENYKSPFSPGGKGLGLGGFKENLLYIFYSCIVGIIIALIIQQIIHFDRPEKYLESAGRMIMSHVPDASFPSDHATISFAFLTSLFFAGYKKIGLIFLPFVIIMNISRIMVGVHWPFDVLVGAIVGIFSSIITFKYIYKIELVKKLNLSIIKLAKFFKL